jgi:UDP-glucose 4-epimerase
MNKVSLITGVAGCVGFNLAKLLLKKNHLVYGLDNFSKGSKNNLKDLLKNKNFFFKKINLDEIKNINLLKNFLPNTIDYAWLLAANSDILKGVKNFDIDYKNTFLTTLNTVSAIKHKLKNKKAKIIFTSSSAIYGPVNKIIDEQIYSFNPISNYGKYKLYSEFFLESFSRMCNAKTLILRFPNVVGNPFTHGILYDFFRKYKKNNTKLKILGDGNQRKPYCHVKEIVNCMYFLSKKNFLFDTLLLGPNDNGIKVKKIAKIFKKQTQKNLKLIFEKKTYGWKGDVIKYNYSVNKLNKMGYRFKYSSSEAIIYSVNELFQS